MNELPKTLTAAVLTKAGKPLEIIRDIEVPELRYGQVLVKISYAGLCRSQLMEARGNRGVDKWIPHMLGHEGTGTVIATHESITKVKNGDQVVLGWIKGKGIEAGGSKYKHINGTINAGPVTTFSNYAVVSENRIVRHPEGTPLHYGVMYGCALPTGAGVVFNLAKPKKTDSIAIVGLGGIGFSSVMAASNLGVSKIFAIDIEPHKLKLALEIGATHIINPNETNVQGYIQNATGGIGVDFAIDAGGHVETIEMAFDLVRRGGGRCIFASHPEHEGRITLDPFELICGKKIEGTWGGGSEPDRDIPMLGEFYRDGKLPLEKLISAPYKLEEINQAMDDLQNRVVNRALIEIN